MAEPLGGKLLIENELRMKTGKSVNHNDGDG